MCNMKPEITLSGNIFIYAVSCSECSIQKIDVDVCANILS